MKKEASHTKVLQGEVITEESQCLKTGFHDEFDALEWCEKHLAKGTKVTILTERVIEL